MITAVFVSNFGVNSRNYFVKNGRSGAGTSVLGSQVVAPELMATRA